MTSEATTATPKRKVNRKPLNYMLCSIRKDADGVIIGFDVVPTPDTDKDKPTRDDYKRGVRKALEAGENAEDYNGKQLTVVGFPDPFCLTAEVKEVTVRKVSISES